MPLELIFLTLSIALISSVIRAYRGLSTFSYLVILTLTLIMPFAIAYLMISCTLTSCNPQEFEPIVATIACLPIIYALLAPVRSKTRNRALKNVLITR